MSAAQQNAHGQGVSHATDHSKVPEKIQEAAPAGLERKLPENVRYTFPRSPSPSFPFEKLQAYKKSGSSNGRLNAQKR